MKPPAWLSDGVLAPLRSAAARVDALPRRERLALFAAALALVGAVEFLLVQPDRARRQAIEDATVEQAQRVADEQTQAEQQRVQKHDALQAQLARLDRELAQLGAGASSGQSLGFLLTQALARQDVRIVSLRELAVEAIQAAVDPAAAAQPGAAPPSSAALYRHRFELTLGGAPAELINALRALDQGARPLRVERVRMSGQSDSTVQLAVTLLVIGTERAWLAICHRSRRSCSLPRPPPASRSGRPRRSRPRHGPPPATPHRRPSRRSPTRAA